MLIRRNIAVLMIATSVLGGVAYAADTASQVEAQQKQTATINKKIDQDVGKLSQDGQQALHDIQQTRLAIFNAQPDQAKSLIHKAKDEMQKAAKDDVVFMKAKSELTTPGAPDAAAKPADTSKDQAQQIAWLPVDTQLTVGEGFVPTPEKMAAVNEANDKLKSADRKGALEKLAVADVDVQFVTAVLPLQQTTTDINKAADLIDQGKYYEANAALKDATDQAMLNIVDIYGQPYKAKPVKTAENKAPDKPAAATPAPGDAGKTVTK